MNKITHPTSQGTQPVTLPQNSFAPDGENGKALRQAFARFATGVTIVSTQSDLGPLGMTANSFSSISLDPALVMWSPGQASARHDAFARAHHFNIHVLAADQLALAQHFAMQGDGFDAFDWAPSPNGTPTLSGCLATFHCTRFAVHPAGDHSLVLGRVDRVDERTDAATGLVFAQGRFGQFTAT